MNKKTLISLISAGALIVSAAIILPIVFTLPKENTTTPSINKVTNPIPDNNSDDDVTVDLPDAGVITGPGTDIPDSGADNGDDTPTNPDPDTDNEEETPVTPDPGSEPDTDEEETPVTPDPGSEPDTDDGEETPVTPDPGSEPDTDEEETPVVIPDPEPETDDEEEETSVNPDPEPETDDEEETPVTPDPEPEEEEEDTTPVTPKTVMEEYMATFPKSVTAAMTTRKMRYHHWLWHQVRENWNKFTDATKDAFRNIGWEPPNPARNFDAAGTSSGVYDNYSGEEFLYMHRQMIQHVNEIITLNNEPMGNITGWKSIPAPNNTDWPVPPNYTVPDNELTTASTNNRKTDDFYTRYILSNERILSDPARLKKMNLSEVGVRTELTVHAYIHMRWSAESPYGYRTSYRGTIPYVDPKWDNPEYIWLADSYASHVHPLFWKIHGWVDDRIELWKQANGVETIEWKGTWTGGPMSALSNVVDVQTASMRGASAMNGVSRGSTSTSASDTTFLDEVFKIFQDSGVPESNWATDFVLPDDSDME